MKQIIMDVLDDMSDSQINLASYAARETVSSLISAALKTKGTYTEYGDYELDEQNARATWVCSICGENTFEVDSDYIGSGTNHLGCEMKSWDEIKDYVKDVDEQTHAQGRGSSHEYVEDIPEGLKRAKELSQEALEEGIRREKNWSQKKHEDKVFGHMTDKYRFEEDELAEEIVDNKDKKYIYESPDGGKTVYKRKFGETERELYKEKKDEG